MFIVCGIYIIFWTCVLIILNKIWLIFIVCCLYYFVVNFYWVLFIFVGVNFYCVVFKLFCC